MLDIPISISVPRKGTVSLEKGSVFILASGMDVSDELSIMDTIYTVGMKVQVEKILDNNPTFLAIKAVPIAAFEIYNVIIEGNVPLAIGSSLLPVLSESQAEVFNTQLKKTIKTFSLLVKSGALDDSLTEIYTNAETDLAKMNIFAAGLLSENKDRFKFLSERSLLVRLNSLVVQINKKILQTKLTDDTRFSLKGLDEVRDAPPLYSPEWITRKYEELPIPESVKSYLERDMFRLDIVSKASSEYSALIDYLTFVLDLPWGQTLPKSYDLKVLVSEMDKTHSGLNEVKESILGFATIERIRQTSASPILCFIGPPGTGKTSIAMSIAKATNRPLVQIALGGVTDESEIRGHRRTYLGSRPGRIVAGLKYTKSMSPLFLLDEVDKLGSDRGGDPSSALLELLDPTQNQNFIDRYLEFPIDLSSAMFILTANYKEKIPPALRDRMEFVYFEEYQRTQREEILLKHILPKAYEEYNLNKEIIKFNKTSITKLIDEPQVRQAEKQLKHLLRKAAVKHFVQEATYVEITERDFPETKERKTKFGF